MNAYIYYFLKIEKNQLEAGKVDLNSLLVVAHGQCLQDRSSMAEGPGGGQLLRAWWEGSREKGELGGHVPRDHLCSQGHAR